MPWNSSNFEANSWKIFVWHNISANHLLMEQWPKTNTTLSNPDFYEFGLNLNLTRKDEGWGYLLNYDLFFLSRFQSDKSWSRDNEWYPRDGPSPKATDRKPQSSPQSVVLKATKSHHANTKSVVTIWQKHTKRDNDLFVISIFFILETIQILSCYCINKHNSPICNECQTQ